VHEDGAIASRRRGKDVLTESESANRMLVGGKYNQLIIIATQARYG